MLARLLVALIRVYQLTLSKVILALAGPVCRFQPSCSRYAIACIEGHGALRGSLLSVKRLCRCHPLNPGGYDPPPPPRRPTTRRDVGASADAPRAGAAAPPPSAPLELPTNATSAAAATSAPDSAPISAPTPHRLGAAGR